MAGEEWYYARAGQRMGPYTAAQMKSAYEQGQVTDADLVWTSGMANWLPAGQVRDQFLNAAAPDPLAALGIPRVDFDMNQPASSVRPVVSMSGGEYAGFWLRLVAYIVDTLVLLPLALGFGCLMSAGGMMGTGGFEPGASPEVQQGVMALTSLAGNLVVTIIGILYFTFMESSSKQATLGKMALGLKVTDSDGYPISFGKALGRNLGKILSGIICYIGFIMAGFTERKQGLHDMLAGTLVVRK